MGDERGPSGCGSMKGNGWPRDGSDGNEVGIVTLSLLAVSGT